MKDEPRVTSGASTSEVLRRSPVPPGAPRGLGRMLSAVLDVWTPQSPAPPAPCRPTLRSKLITDPHIFPLQTES